MALACDGGLALIYDMETFQKIAQVTAQRPDITSLIYARDDVLVIGQVAGFIDVFHLTETTANVTHSLQIKEAGDINSMAKGPDRGSQMIGSQKGLIQCQVTDYGNF